MVLPIKLPVKARRLIRAHLTDVLAPHRSGGSEINEQTPAQADQDAAFSKPAFQIRVCDKRFTPLRDAEHGHTLQ
jgi:hypothetical protein